MKYPPTKATKKKNYLQETGRTLSLCYRVIVDKNNEPKNVENLLKKILKQLKKIV